MLNSTRSVATEKGIIPDTETVVASSIRSIAAEKGGGLVTETVVHNSIRSVRDEECDGLVGDRSPNFPGMEKIIWMCSHKH